MTNEKINPSKTELLLVRPTKTQKTHLSIEDQLISEKRHLIFLDQIAIKN